MVSRLVLIRHAKTQAGGPDLPDKERELTLAGRRSIEARYPVSLQLLADIDARDVCIWSSPAFRALQTADVVARGLGIGGIEVKESLYDGDIDAFMAELADETGTIIAVGHNPFMEELFARLGGIGQQMKPGAMGSLAFDLSANGAVAISSRLEWFVQGPHVASWQTIVDLEDALAKAGKRITRCADELSENPDDPEALHQYRISLRVSRSLLKFMLPYCKRGSVRATLATLKELQTPTSLVRELDMLVRELGEDAPERAEVEATRAHERAAFLEHFAARDTQKKIKRVASELKQVPWRAEVKSCGIDSRALAARVAQMREQYEENMAQIAYEEHEQVHEVRKQAKALRYAAREFAACLPEDAGQTGAQAKAVQDKLGDLCDCRNNARLVIEICGADAVATAARFIMRADEIVAELNAQRV